MGPDLRAGGVSYGYLLVAAGFLAFAVCVCLFESHRIRRTGIDPITIFIGLMLLQACLAGITIFTVLPFANPQSPTGNDVFDYIYLITTPASALLVLCLAVWFVVFFYCGSGIGLMAIRHLPVKSLNTTDVEVSVRPYRLFGLLVGGLFVTLLSFYLLGDTWLQRLTNLILFRSEIPGIERNALNANAFGLTQTWSWLSVLAAFLVFQQKGRWWLKAFCFVAIVIFALLGVSRRALFLPFLLGYLAVALHTGKWHWRWVVAGFVPLVLWLAFGKELLSTLAFGGRVESVAGNYQSWLSGMLRAASDVGITIVESLGTVTLLPSHLRLGFDHVLSVARRFPDGMLGLNIEFPERIVRVSTTAFSSGDAQDIPPGMMGQMWLDFRLFGPMLWGLFFGLQMAAVQFLYRRVRSTPVSAIVFALVVFVVALPVNTGSFDFTLSLDIIVLVWALWWCVKYRANRPALPSALPAQPV